MDSVSGSVSFGFDLDDNVTPTTEKMIGAQEKLANKAKVTTNEFDRQRLKNIECLASLNAFRGGLNQVTMSMHELGITDDKTYETMRKLVAGITLVTATAETLKGAVLVYNMLTAASTRYAVASIFAAAANNPLLAAVSIAGAGAIAYGAISMMNQSNVSSTGPTVGTTVNNITTNNFTSAPDRTQRAISSGLTTGSYY